MAIGNFPDHVFESAHFNEDDLHPDAICVAHIQTASFEVEGYEFFAQCGHTRKEHIQAMKRLAEVGEENAE